ncbi:BTE_collapsed_G0013930.mRNA.1.CDS.1 [Saccharomyces cerevisiae]|nr:BTE_collapsed_G0013930.mRNA.1.CDS.1 [Saccharomyces cerevisiae]
MEIENERVSLKKQTLTSSELALNNKNDLVHCPSITLFESIPTEVRSFYEDEKVWPNQSGKIQNWYNG